MSNPIHSFAERFPEHREAILKLSETNVAFKDQCHRFAEIWDQLNELETGDVSGEGGESQRLRREAENLENEMLGLVRDHMRI